MTRVLTVNPAAPERDAIAEAAAVIRAGGLVAFPTETVYGLGANALDAAAVEKIFAAKGRPASDPLIVHLAEAAALPSVARDEPPLADVFAARFWPGPLTLVLPRAPAVPYSVTAMQETVAVRVPAHPVALALLRAAALPIAAPSANLFARPSPTTAAHVLDDLRGRVDLVLDGGSTPVGVESTILDLTRTPPVVLRPGGVPLEQLRELAPDLTYTPRYLAHDENAAAPGMLLRHYSPRAELLLWGGDDALPAMLTAAREALAAGRRVGVLVSDDDMPTFSTLDVERAALGVGSDVDAVARALFAGLRALDARGVDVILARGVGRAGLGLAVWDRLVRAAEGRVMDTQA